MLPMVKIQKRDRSPYSAGVVCLQTLLARRLGSRSTNCRRFLHQGAPRPLITTVAVTFVSLCRSFKVVHVHLGLTDFSHCRPPGHQMVCHLQHLYPRAFWSKTIAELDLDPQQQIRNGDADY